MYLLTLRVNNIKNNLIDNGRFIYKHKYLIKASYSVPVWSETWSQIALIQFNVSIVGGTIEYRREGEGLGRAGSLAGACLCKSLITRCFTCPLYDCLTLLNFLHQCNFLHLQNNIHRLWVTFTWFNTTVLKNTSAWPEKIRKTQSFFSLASV